MVAAAAGPSVSLGAPRAPARHCGAPAAAARSRAAEALGPLSRAACFLTAVRVLMQKGRDAPQRQGGGHLTEASGDSGLCCLAIRCLLALRGLWVKDLPTGLQSYILSPDQPPAFAASNSLTLKLRHWVMDGKWGKGQKPFIFHQCPALLHTSLARKDKKEAGQAIPSFVYLNNDACHEKYAESHSKGSSMPGAKKEPSPGQREQACPRESNSLLTVPHLSRLKR